jgi:hypothetical protein
MCIFCAAIPVTLAMGARLNAKQKNNQEITAPQGQAVHLKHLPVGALTIIAVSGLTVSAVIYHTHFANRQ